MHDILFSPFTVKSLTLKNRIVMAPMTRSFSPGGVPGDDVAAYYRRRAEGGVGLILSEGTSINRATARNDVNVPTFHGDSALSGWQTVIDGVHAAGGRMGPQIWHVGVTPNARDGTWLDGPIDSPSGIKADGTPEGAAVAPAMDDSAIADTLAAYGQAAADARRLGFDTLEIHAAHGYLIDQFFWPMTNRREDRFGGVAMEARTRFAVEVVRHVRAAVGPDFPILMRLSQWKVEDYAARIATTPDAMAQWLTPLAEAGVDMIHCSQRRYWDAEFPEIDGADGLNFAGWAKKLTGLPTISVGSVGLSGEFMATLTDGKGAKPASLERLLERMERGEFDLIAVGRALLSDPAWASKVQAMDLAAMHDFSTEHLRTLS